MVKGERFNSISHLVGAALALAGVVVLVVTASYDGHVRRIVSFSIYGSTLFLLYLISTLYHGLPIGRAKRVFRVLDHQAIYLLIAGSYTPLTLISLNGVVGWWMFGVIWGMAVLGLVLDALPIRGARILPMIIYFTMGWMIVLAIKPLLEVLPFAGFLWLLAGGGVLHIRHRVLCSGPAVSMDARSLASIRTGRQHQSLRGDSGLCLIRSGHRFRAGTVQHVCLA